MRKIKEFLNEPFMEVTIGDGYDEDNDHKIILLRNIDFMCIALIICLIIETFQ
jgi:hypothetical protein